MSGKTFGTFISEKVSNILICRMAASVIRTLSAFGPRCPAQTRFIPADEDELEDEYEEELRDEVEDSFEEEDEDSTGVESQLRDVLARDLCTDMTNRLLRFAELISSDVQRYFGRAQDSDTYMGRSRSYYSNVTRVTSSEQGDEPENLGPLAELFQSTQVKKQGLPMIQRSLPSSFWTEPRPDCGGVDIPHVVTCVTETISSGSNSMSSSTTPDFSDLLAHWASERDSTNEFNCDYQLP